MLPLVLKAYAELVRIDFPLRRNDFAGLYARVRRMRAGKPPENPFAVESICGAVDRAAVWYWRQVSCLHRSAATTCLLREAGIAARLVIGAQAMPFRAHAWVEVEGRIVNDKPYISELYATLDRC